MGIIAGLHPCYRPVWDDRRRPFSTGFYGKRETLESRFLPGETSTGGAISKVFDQPPFFDKTFEKSWRRNSQIR
ncbi:MAG: hypothetical protein LBH32_14520 [Dysgonamonadaceae bacterium]|jgi:hypothetical protein|nr:hypothetical protein [Dysgonamonadaceae bacterium]